MVKQFDKNNKRLCNQYNNIEWIEDSGVSPEELQILYETFMTNNIDLPKNIIKAKTFEMILDHSRIALDKDDIFQEKLYGVEILGPQRQRWQEEILGNQLKEETQKVLEADQCGAYRANCDFSHTSPNSKLLLEIGFSGVLERIEKHAAKDGLTKKQKEFYQSCEICLSAILRFIKKLANAIEPFNKENSIALNHIATGKPQNIYEAMQLIIVYFYLHDYIGATRVRTLGRLDDLLYPFYENDIKNGTYTKEEIKEMLKFFFNKIWTANVLYDLPLCLGGLDENGNEVTNEISYLLVETYNELNIYSPKIHIRVSDKTPETFIKLVLKCIRGGNSSFVFLNDNVTIDSLIQVGTEEKDALNYVPIGCYEPAVWGKEIGCTGTGGVNLAKAIEFTFTDGRDYASGKQVSVHTGQINTYEEFVAAIKTHIKYMTECSLDYVRNVEKYYGEIGPDPLLSSMYDHSVETGVDVYEGGAKYNNSSYCFYFTASLVDSMFAVKRLVFDEKKISFEQLYEVLKSDWAGNEKLRLIVKSLPEKYGNNIEEVDALMKEMTDYCASLVNNKPNGRGGVFKASLFSINRYLYFGERTMATPDGRLAGEPLSKNLCATVGMDKKGVTALINSVTKIDHSKFSNGVVFDVMLHPSAVTGEDGLEAFNNLLKTYISKGGMAFHGNVFNPEDLKNAQKNPEKYKNLQVRVCGWNAYFVNLSKVEQDCFIKQSETSFY